MKRQRNVKYSNYLADLARIQISKYWPQFDHECPFIPGWYNGSNIDANGTLAPLMPLVIPAGMFFDFFYRYINF